MSLCAYTVLSVLIVSLASPAMAAPDATPPAAQAGKDAAKDRSGEPALTVTQSQNGCVAVRRETQGQGLRIPNQVVCPIAKKTE